MAVYTETINLDGNMSERAREAAKGIATLEAGIVAANAAMTRAAALGDGKAFDAAEAKAKAFRAAIDEVPPALVAEAKAAGDAKAQSEALGKALDAVGGVALKVAAGLAAATVAMGALVLKGVELALSASDAKGDMILLFDSLGDGALTGQQAIAMFDALGAKTGQTREHLAKTAQAFAAMGVTGVDQLERLTLAAVSASEMAKGGGEAFELMYKKIAAAQATGQALKIPLKGLGSLADMGLKVDDVAKQMGISAAQLGSQLGKGTVNAKAFGEALQKSLIEKGAGRVADAATDLTNTWARAKENIGKFFEDIDTGPFLAELAKVFGLLDQGSDTGKVLKVAIGGFFKEVFAVLTQLLPVARDFLVGLVTWGLKAYIALKPMVDTMRELAASGAGQMAIEGLTTALKLMAIAAGVVLVTVGGLAALGVATAAALGEIVGAVAALAGLVISTLTGWAVTANEMGANFVKGLVAGITAGASSVVSAVQGLASAASSAFTNALDMHSPSRLMADHGANIGAGVAVGVEASAGDVEAASSGMASAAVAGVEGASSGGGGAPAGGGVTVTIEPGAIVIQGGSGESVSELTEQAVAMIFERIALAQGLA